MAWLSWSTLRSRHRAFASFPLYIFVASESRQSQRNRSSSVFHESPTAIFMVSSKLHILGGNLSHRSLKKFSLLWSDTVTITTHHSVAVCYYYTVNDSFCSFALSAITQKVTTWKYTEWTFPALVFQRMCTSFASFTLDKNNVFNRIVPNIMKRSKINS